MGDETVCANCGMKIVGEDPAAKQPCPKCGSLSRVISMAGAIEGHAGTSADLTVIHYADKLLEVARRLINEGEYSVATVVMHMACEISVQRALSGAFAKRGISYLEEPVEEFLNGYNLKTDRIRKLYNALTGRPVQDEPFWLEFCQSSTRRNKIAHEGAQVTREEAEKSYEATKALVDYLYKDVST